MTWKRHPRYRDYLISTNGDIKSPRSNKVLQPWKVATGYMRVEVYRAGKYHSEYVHRLVAETFLPRPIGKDQVNHLNGIKHDNRLENLEWTNHKRNLQHHYKNSGNRAMLIEVYDKFTSLAYYFQSIAELARVMNVSYSTANYMLHGTVASPPGIRLRRLT